MLESSAISSSFSNVRDDISLTASLKDAEVQFATVPVAEASFDRNHLVVTDAAESFWEDDWDNKQDFLKS